MRITDAVSKHQPQLLKKYLEDVERAKELQQPFVEELLKGCTQIEATQEKLGNLTGKIKATQEQLGDVNLANKLEITQEQQQEVTLTTNQNQMEKTQEKEVTLTTNCNQMEATQEKEVTLITNQNQMEKTQEKVVTLTTNCNQMEKTREKEATLTGNCKQMEASHEQPKDAALSNKMEVTQERNSTLSSKKKEKEQENIILTDNLQESPLNVSLPVQELVVGDDIGQICIPCEPINEASITETLAFLWKVEGNQESEDEMSSSKERRIRKKKKKCTQKRKRGDSSEYYVSDSDVENQNDKKASGSKGRENCTRKTKKAVVYNSDSEGSLSNSDSMYVPETEIDDSGSDAESDNDCNDRSAILMAPKIDSQVDEDSDASEIIPFTSPQYSNNVQSSDDEDSVENYGDIVKDTNNPYIYYRAVDFSEVTKAGKPKKNVRVANSLQACPFGCKQFYRNFAQHVLKSELHRKEAKVKQINNINISELTREEKRLKLKERKTLLTKLRLRGNHLHNIQVLQRGRGQVFLSRRKKSETLDISKYGPCPNCLDWVKKGCITRHQKLCPGRGQPEHCDSLGSLLTQSDVLAGRIQHKASKPLLEEVFPMMRNDNISQIAKNDELIIAHGNDWMTKNTGNRLMRRHYTSAKMRLMARLLQHLLENVTRTEGTTTLEHYISPKYFDNVVQAALHCARQTVHDEEELESPSNAIKLSYDLKRVASIKMADAIASSNTLKRKEAKDFLKLMSIKWSNKLATVALQAKRRLKKAPLPLPEDIQQLSSFLKENCTAFNIEDASYRNFREAVVLALSRLVTYNRRRCGEVQAMFIENYAMRTKGMSEVSSELVGELTKLEKKLIESQDCIMIKGKSTERTGKDVPVVTPPDTQKLLEYLTDKQVRGKAGINPANPYVFANDRAGVIRAYDAITTVVKRANLRAPKLVRATNLRKYMATMTQSFDISHQQYQWVLDHLGHTADVHVAHYRAMSDVIERKDVAKLLLLQDRGLVGKYHGQRLQDIPLEEIVFDQEPDSEQGGSPARPDSEQGGSPARPDSEQGGSPARPDSEPEEPDLEEDYVPNMPEDTNYDIWSDDELIAPEKKRKKKVIYQRHRWSQEELAEVHKIFRKHIHIGKTPGKKDLEKGIRKSKQANGKLWLLRQDIIKKKVSWIICQAKRE